MVVKEVVSALQVLISDVSLHCEVWPDSGTFEVLTMEYFARSNGDYEKSETSELEILETRVELQTRVGDFLIKVGDQSWRFSLHDCNIVLVYACGL